MATQVSLNSGAISSAGSLKLQTNGTTDAVTIDTAQNAGLGVTPSAWGTDRKALQLGARGALWSSTTSGSTHLSNNTYYNAGFSYIATGTATAYEQGSGSHIWYNAVSGTAGNAISFTQAMTLDASGNLGIGATSPVSKLDIRSSGLSGTDKVIFQITDSTNTTFQINQTTSYSQIMANNALTFSNGTTERARIDSSGNFLVGTTNSSNTSGTGFKVWPTGLVAAVAPSTTSDTFNYYNSTAGAFRFYVNNAGTIFATSTTISAISDERLKENVRDLEFGLSEVMALKPRRFDWKEGKGQDKKNAAGFIAQEFETVFPASVGTSKAGEDGVEYKNINHEELIPTLVKAIQELKAEVDALKGQA